MTRDDRFELTEPEDEELFAGLQRSVAGAAVTTSLTDVVALGRRTRTRHRAVAVGVGTSMAALVAAIGVLAPSAGTGAGGGQALTIQDAGFSLQKGTDGVVKLTVHDAFDRVKLKAALDKIGIKFDSQSVKLPADWDDNGPIPGCAETPAVHTDLKAMEEAIRARQAAAGADPEGTVLPPGAPSPVAFEFRPSQVPAGDVVSLVQFVHDIGGGQIRGVMTLTILTGMPDKCELVSHVDSQSPAAHK